MKEGFWMVSRNQPGEGPDLTFLGPERAGQVRRFHSSFPMYRPTPLVSLEDTARALGLGQIYIKDESEILHHQKHVLIDHQTKVACNDAGKKHEGDTKTDSEYLDSSQCESCCTYD